MRMQLVCLVGAFVITGEAKPRPDVLFVAIDDMNDWISLLDPEAPIKTPNLERLAGEVCSLHAPTVFLRPAIHRGVRF